MGCSSPSTGDSTDNSSTDTSSTDSSSTDSSSTDTSSTDTSSTDEDSSDTSTTGEAECGDGIVQPGEACDDGNTDEFDMCTQLCTETPQPVLELSFSAIKQFDFSWAPVVEADHYQLLESVDVGEPFVQLGGDIVGESISITMPLHLRAHASYRLRACTADGCWESASVDVLSNLVEAVGYGKASNPGSIDQFGSSVVLSGDGQTLAVGAFTESSNASGIDGNQADDSLVSAGAVYVFGRIGTTWAQQAYVKASNPDEGDSFGWGVALSDDGNTLAVGAARESSNAAGIDGDQSDDSLGAAGAVYVFVRNGNVWSQQAYIKAAHPGAADFFGDSLALSGDGDTLAVGALGEDSSATGIDGDQTDDSLAGAGAVYIFSRTGSVWSQQTYIKASNPDSGDIFGQSVALASDSNTLVVGAIGESSSATGIDGAQNDDSLSYAGAVYVFARDGETWSQQAYVKSSNPDENDHFGGRVAVSDDGDTFVVGARWEDSSTTGINGSPPNDLEPSAGAAYVFARDGGVWSQQAYVKASSTGWSDKFGVSVALSSDGDILAVGAEGQSGGAMGIEGDADGSAPHSGAVYVFVRTGGVWSQRAYVKASDTKAGDSFGYGCALSNDGETLAVGAYGEDSNATGFGGNQADVSIHDAGAVYLY